MATEPKPTRPMKRNRRRKPREEIVDYIVAIEDWDWGYSFSVDSGRVIHVKNGSWIGFKRSIIRVIKW